MGVRSLILSIAFLRVIGCSSSEKADQIPDEVTGIVVLIGAEPFTKLGLKVPDGKTYILRCELQIAELLRMNQGKRARVHVRGTELAPEGAVLLIESALIVQHSTNE